MFYVCEKFNQDLSKWNVSNGKYFSKMFYGCKSFRANLSKWNTKMARNWDNFVTNSLLAKYPNRIPVEFRKGYL